MSPDPLYTVRSCNQTSAAPYTVRSAYYATNRRTSSCNTNDLHFDQAYGKRNPQINYASLHNGVESQVKSQNCVWVVYVGPGAHPTRQRV